MAPGSCRGGFGELGEFRRLGKRHPWTSIKGHCLRPQGLVGAAGKVCRGLSGAWELQGRVWEFLRAGKRQLWTSIKRRCTAWGFGELGEFSKAGKRQPWTSIKGHCHEPSGTCWSCRKGLPRRWVAPGSCRGGFGEFLRAGKRQPWTSHKIDAATRGGFGELGEFRRLARGSLEPP